MEPECTKHPCRFNNVGLVCGMALLTFENVGQRYIFNLSCCRSLTCAMTHSSSLTRHWTLGWSAVNLGMVSTVDRESRYWDTEPDRNWILLDCPSKKFIACNE